MKKSFQLGDVVLDERSKDVYMIMNDHVNSNVKYITAYSFSDSVVCMMYVHDLQLIHRPQ